MRHNQLLYRLCSIARLFLATSILNNVSPLSLSLPSPQPRSLIKATIRDANTKRVFIVSKKISFLFLMFYLFFIFVFSFFPHSPYIYTSPSFCFTLFVLISITLNRLCFYIYSNTYRQLIIIIIKGSGISI